MKNIKKYFVYFFYLSSLVCSDEQSIPVEEHQDMTTTHQLTKPQHEYTDISQLAKDFRYTPPIDELYYHVKTKALKRIKILSPIVLYGVVAFYIVFYCTVNGITPLKITTVEDNSNSDSSKPARRIIIDSRLVQKFTCCWVGCLAFSILPYLFLSTLPYPEMLLSLSQHDSIPFHKNSSLIPRLMRWGIISPDDLVENPSPYAMNDRDMILSAFHEASHAIVTQYSQYFKIKSANIQTPDNMLRRNLIGTVYTLPVINRSFGTREMYEAELAICMSSSVIKYEKQFNPAGICVIGDTESDLFKAKRTAFALLDGKDIFFSIPDTKNPHILCSDRIWTHKEKQFETELNDSIEKGYEKAKQILTEHYTEWVNIAKALLIKPSLTPEEIDEICMQGTLLGVSLDFFDIFELQKMFDYYKLDNKTIMPTYFLVNKLLHNFMPKAKVMDENIETDTGTDTSTEVDINVEKTDIDATDTEMSELRKEIEDVEADVNTNNATDTEQEHLD